jgi:hypothetical protein
MVGGPPLHCAIKKGGGRQHTERGSPCAAKPTENPSRSEGTQEQREAAASASLEFSPLQPTPSRRRRHRPRHRRPGVDLSASLVAALERISINEPEMAAGSSSSTGGEGFSTLFLSMYFRRSRISCTQNHRKEKEIPLDPYTVLILEA